MLTFRNRSRLSLLAAAASTAAIVAWLARLAARPAVVWAFQSPVSPVPAATTTSTTLALTDTVIEIIVAVIVLAVILFVWRRVASRRTR